MALPRRRSGKRWGTTAVELAVILPVFFTFVFGIIEYGRLQLVNNLLKASCRSAARLGATEGVSTAEAQARVEEILGTTMNPSYVTVLVKDASVFDDGGTLPSTPSDYEGLPDLDLDAATPRQLFMIRASVPYNDIAFIPFSVLDGVTLTGQAIMRHE